MKQDYIWDFYQNEAPETFSGSVARLTFLARKVKPNSKVLDIGVGAGVFEEVAIKMGLDVYALDPSERSIELLRQRFGMGEKARVGYSQNMPFADRFFEAVVISELVEHLSEDITEQTLSEISRILVPGGRVIGTVPARENLRESLVVCPDCGSLFHRWGHVQSFDTKRMRALLSRNFEVEEVFERPFFTWSAANWKGKIEAVVRLLLYRLGVHGSNENIVFVARKPCA